MEAKAPQRSRISAIETFSVSRFSGMFLVLVLKFELRSVKSLRLTSTRTFCESSVLLWSPLPGAVRSTVSMIVRFPFFVHNKNPGHLARCRPTRPARRPAGIARQARPACGKQRNALRSGIQLSRRSPSAAKAHRESSQLACCPPPITLQALNEIRGGVTCGRPVIGAGRRDFRRENPAVRAG